MGDIRNESFGNKKLRTNLHQKFMDENFSEI